MGAHNETCTDMEFIQLWGQLQSAQRMAEHLGINNRAVHLRRRWIEKTEGLALSKLGVKAVTGSPYSNVHPDYNTYIGDAITNNSASAIKLLLAGDPVSEEWSRDGVESLPLLDIIVQELANLKGRTNYRILATLERREIVPYRSFLYNGRYWALISYQLNCRTGTAQIELYDLGIEPTS